MLATFLPGLIKRHAADIDITVVVREQYGELLFGNPSVDKILLVDSDGKLPRRFLRNRIKETQPDLCLDLQSTLASRLLTLGGGMPKTVRLRKETGKRYLMICGKSVTRSLSRRHVVESYFDAAQRCLAGEGVSLERSDMSPCVYLREKEVQQVRESFAGSGRFKGNGSSGLVFGVCPGSKWETKKWGAERFAALAERIVASYGAPVLVVGSDAERPELYRIKETVSSSARDAVIPFSGGLRDLACALSLCDVVVSNDSGLMHLAGAVGSRVVALFGPTVTGFGFAPWGGGNRVIGIQIWCRPCTLHGSRRCPLGHHKCMRLISPDNVLQVVSEVVTDAQRSPA